MASAGALCRCICGTSEVEREKVDQVRVFLHVNGFRFFADGQEVAISLSPFTLVRNCKFQSTQAGMNFSEFKIFKILGIFCASCWVYGLFMIFRVTPLPTVRKGAGGCDHLRTCAHQLSEMYVTERSICCEKIGINCSCFSVEEHQFSARSLAERKLWLRAISNLKAPHPNPAACGLGLAEGPVAPAVAGAAVVKPYLPNLGTLPSPPSPMDLRLSERATRLLVGPLQADEHGADAHGDASGVSTASARLQRSSSMTEPQRREEHRVAGNLLRMRMARIPPEVDVGTLDNEFQVGERQRLILPSGIGIAPFQTKDAGHVCRCIALGKVASKGKARTAFHGLSLSPAAAMPETALKQRPANTTPNPFAAPVVAGGGADGEGDEKGTKRDAAAMEEGAF
eukprot:g23449.t1